MTTNVPNAKTLQARWVTSSYSGGGNDCVQAAALPNAQLAVRDSKNPSGPALVFRANGWRTFLADIRREDVDTR